MEIMTQKRSGCIFLQRKGRLALPSRIVQLLDFPTVLHDLQAYCVCFDIKNLKYYRKEEVITFKWKRGNVRNPLPSTASLLMGP